MIKLSCARSCCSAVLQGTRLLSSGYCYVQPGAHLAVEFHRLKHRELSQSNLQQYGYDEAKDRDKQIQGKLEASGMAKTLVAADNHTHTAHCFGLYAGFCC